MGETKNELIEVLPSQFPTEGYVRLKVRCCCCKHQIREHDGAEYRKEDLDEILKMKPLCPNCAEHLKGWQKQREALEAEIKEVLEDMKRIPNGRLPLGKNAWLQEWCEVQDRLQGLVKK